MIVNKSSFRVLEMCSIFVAGQTHGFLPSRFVPPLFRSITPGACSASVGLFDVLDETTDFLSLDGRYKSDGTTPELMHQNLCE